MQNLNAGPVLGKEVIKKKTLLGRARKAWCLAHVIVGKERKRDRGKTKEISKLSCTIFNNKR